MQPQSRRTPCRGVKRDRFLGISQREIQGEGVYRNDRIYRRNDHEEKNDDDLLEGRRILAWETSRTSGNYDAGRDARRELEENIKDAYLLMAMDEVPEEYQMKEIAI